MRKNFIFIILLSLTFSLFSLVIENADKPAKGNWDFKPEQVWRVDQAGKDLLTRVGRIRTDEKGNVYVMEFKQGKIYVLNEDGKLINSIGKRGEGPGEYKMAYNFFISGNVIIVPEMGRIHYFDKSGKFIKTFIGRSFIFPRDFIDKDRMIYVKSDREGKGKDPESINIFNLITKKQKILMTVPPEKSISAQKGGMRLVIKDSQTTPVVIVSVSGNFILLGKSDKYEIRKIDFNGKELMRFSINGRKQKSIPEKMKRKRFENIMVNGGKMPKEMVDMMIKSMPDKTTFFSRIITDNSGKIYVFISDLGNENGQEFDIFSPEGKYIYHSNLKIDDYSIKSGITFKDGFIYFFGEDEDGEGALLKFKVNIPK